MNWTQVAYYAASILAGVLIAVVNFIAAKAKKKEDTSSDTVEIPATIKDYAIEAIEQAETTGLKGTMKKAYAVSLIVIKCASLGVNYGSIEQLISDYIDTLVDLTKKVN